MSENKNLNKKTKRESIKNKEENNKDGEIKEKLNDNIIIGIMEVNKKYLKKRLINSYENSQKDSVSIIGKNNEDEIKNVIYI